MSKEYPLYPELSEEAKKEAQLVIDAFKSKLKKAADEAISECYTDIIEYIESDSWTNFRNQLLEGFRDYNNRKIQAEYDFKEIRQLIFKEFREDIIKDLNQDLVQENEELKKLVDGLREDIDRAYRR